MAIVAPFIPAFAWAQTTVGVKIRNTDAEVLETAMLQFFTIKEEEAWQSRDWRRGEVAILFGQLRSKTRETASEVRGAWIQQDAAYESDATHGAMVTAQLGDLRALQKEITALSPSFAAPPIVPLRSLAFDPRIEVGEPKLSFRRSWYDTKLPSGKPGRPRVIAWVSPPSYSGDGQVALVSLHAPWSMHSADILIALRKSGDRWTRLFARSRFYV